MGGFASSRVLDIHGQRMIDQNYEPGFRVELHHKDLNITLDCAKSLGASIPHTQSVQDLFARLIAQGDATLDSSAIATLIDNDAN